jgi:hypothetical protein
VYTYSLVSVHRVSQDALDGAAEELRAHAKSFQPPEGEEALVCPLLSYAFCVGQTDCDRTQEGSISQKRTRTHTVYWCNTVSWQLPFCKGSLAMIK